MAVNKTPAGNWQHTFLIVIVLLCACNQDTKASGQKEGISLSQYLYPRSDPMTFNCVYHTYCVGHDTVKLNFKKLNIENTIAYCIASVDDSDCRYSELASFLGSAMIFSYDSILLAPLQWDKTADSIRLKDFLYYIPPSLNLTDTVLIPLHDRNIKLSNFEYEDFSIEGHLLQSCIKIKITEEYKGVKEPLYGYVRLSKNYGIVNWVRVTGRTELRYLSQK